MKAPARNIRAIAAKIAQPWRVSRTILPNMYVSPAPSEKISNIWSRFVSGVGFSYGWAEFALKYPPPLVPSILITNWDAKGPCSITWVVPSRVVTVAGRQRQGADHLHQGRVLHVPGVITELEIRIAGHNVDALVPGLGFAARRSEEHTSE